MFKYHADHLIKSEIIIYTVIQFSIYLLNFFFLEEIF